MPSEIHPSVLPTASSVLPTASSVLPTASVPTDAHADLLWLKTRDGSPTLWSNSLGESFRSLRGAFTESYWAFIRPALEHAKLRTQDRPLQIGEFGLGLGTNWVLWTHLARLHKIPFVYTAVEQNPCTFEMGLDVWERDEALILNFLAKLGYAPSPMGPALREEARRLQIIPQITDLKNSPLQFDCWFHDPFGAEVNPEGYTLETLRCAEPCWDKNVLGISYACNRVFQDSLKSLGMDVQVVDFEEPIGKRSRLEFRRLQQ